MSWQNIYPITIYKSNLDIFTNCWQNLSNHYIWDFGGRIRRTNIFHGPNLPVPICNQHFFGAQSASKAISGPQFAPAKIFQGVICWGPICRGPICCQKTFGPNLPRTFNDIKYDVPVCHSWHKMIIQQANLLGSVYILKLTPFNLSFAQLYIF